MSTVITTPAPTIDPEAAVRCWRAGLLRAKCLQASLRGTVDDPGELVLAAFERAATDGPQAALAFARGVAKILIERATDIAARSP